MNNAKELTRVYNSRPNDFVSFVQELIDTDRPVNTVNIVTMLNMAGKLRLAFDDNIVKALREKIIAIGDAASCTPKQLSYALYGFNRLSPTEEVLLLLTVLTRMMTTLTPRIFIFEAQHVGDLLFGMKRIGDVVEVRRLLAELAPRISPDRNLTAPAVANALYGMQNVHDSPEARRVLMALVAPVRNCKRELSARHIGNAIHGLQNFPDCHEIRLLLQTLIPLVVRSSAELVGQSVGMALLGIRMIGDTNETRWLMSVFTLKLQRGHTHLKPRDWTYVQDATQRLPPSPTLEALRNAVKLRPGCEVEDRPSDAMAEAPLDECFDD
jgi:hypothetical protein